MNALSDPITFRKRVAGVCLLAFPLAGLVAATTDSSEGTDTSAAKLYGIVAAHHAAILATAIVFCLSAILTVPALGAVLRLTRRRGTVLGHVGAALVMLGAFGHMGYGTWQAMISRIPASSGRAALTAYLSRAALIPNLLLPLLFCISIGLVLIAFAMQRAGVVPAWVPRAALATAVLELILDSTSAGNSKWSGVALWALVTVIFGFIGTRVLALDDERWAAGSAVEAEAESVQGRQPEPTTARVAVGRG
jgi:hypothetical protein